MGIPDGALATGTSAANPDTPPNNAGGSLNDALEWRSLRWESGCVYEGLEAGGSCESHGVVTWPTRRERYEGQLRGSRPHGHGAYRWQDGTLYRGEWYDGHMHGCGVVIWKDERGEIQAKAGKFLADGYVGPVADCSAEAAHAAALEADVAAGRARSFQTSLPRRGPPTGESVPASAASAASAPSSSRGAPSGTAEGARSGGGGGWRWLPWGPSSGQAHSQPYTQGQAQGQVQRLDGIAPAAGWATPRLRAPPSAGFSSTRRIGIGLGSKPAATADGWSGDKAHGQGQGQGQEYGHGRGQGQGRGAASHGFSSRWGSLSRQQEFEQQQQRQQQQPQQVREQRQGGGERRHGEGFGGGDDGGGAGGGNALRQMTPDQERRLEQLLQGALLSGSGGRGIGGGGGATVGPTASVGAGAKAEGPGMEAGAGRNGGS